MTWIGLQGDKFLQWMKWTGMDGKRRKTDTDRGKAEASPSPTVGWTGGRMERKAAGDWSAGVSAGSPRAGAIDGRDGTRGPSFKTSVRGTTVEAATHTTRKLMYL